MQSTKLKQTLNTSNIVKLPFQARIKKTHGILKERHHTMTNKLKLDTKNQVFSEILSNGKKYFVPRFQRDYSWTMENWQDLWEDINALSESPQECHYMGYLVFQELQEPMNFKVIDGQQRLTTFSLLTLAAIKRLKEMDETKRSNALFKNFIGSESIISLETENKLVLNRNNDYRYREAVDGRELPKRNVKKTIKLMQQAHRYFYEQFRKHSKGAEISKIIQQIAQRMLFTVIYIGDELNAYKVFETLNARGVKLSSADLLKNHLFSLIDPLNDTPDEILDRMDQKWEEIGEDIGNKDYAEYILAQWNSNHALTRKSDLFKNIKKEINDKEKANAFLTTLTQNSQLYGALFDGSNEFWRDHAGHVSIKKDLNFLSLFSIRQHHSLLIASYVNLKKNFHTILNWIKTFSLRYNVICKEHPGEQEALYSEISVEISKGTKLPDIKKKILKKFPSDEKFEQNFIEKTMPTQKSNKKARYLLARLEEHYKNNEDIDETGMTVEHILPSNPNDSWIEYFGENWKQFNERLGNMALVSSDTNKAMGQNTFENKKKTLSQSQYHINKDVCKYPEWDGDSVTSRQKEMAKIATKLWRID